jgi:hypothetical protein
MSSLSAGSPILMSIIASSGVLKSPVVTDLSVPTSVVSVFVSGVLGLCC